MRKPMLAPLTLPVWEIQINVSRGTSTTRWYTLKDGQYYYRDKWQTGSWGLWIRTVQHPQPVGDNLTTLHGEAVSVGRRVLHLP